MRSISVNFMIFIIIITHNHLFICNIFALIHDLNELIPVQFNVRNPDLIKFSVVESFLTPLKKVYMYSISVDNQSTHRMGRIVDNDIEIYPDSIYLKSRHITHVEYCGAYILITSNYMQDGYEEIIECVELVKDRDANIYIPPVTVLLELDVIGSFVPIEIEVRSLENNLTKYLTQIHTRYKYLISEIKYRDIILNADVHNVLKKFVTVKEHSLLGIIHSHTIYITVYICNGITVDAEFLCQYPFSGSSTQCEIIGTNIDYGS